jgi:hypothetical protein
MKTFREVLGSVNLEKGSNDKQYSLDIWYEKVKNTPFEELELEDLCRALRQNLCVEHLLTRVIGFIKKDPLVGEFYDGELVASLATVNFDSLSLEQNLVSDMLLLFNNLKKNDFDKELISDICRIHYALSKKGSEKVKGI